MNGWRLTPVRSVSSRPGVSLTGRRAPYVARAARPRRGRGHHALDRDFELAAEAAADRRRNDADLLAREIEHLRQLLARLERRLLRRAHDHDAVLVDVRERCERLEVRVVLPLCREVALDDVRRGGDRRID